MAARGIQESCLRHGAPPRRAVFVLAENSVSSSLFRHLSLARAAPSLRSSARGFSRATLVHRPPSNRAICTQLYLSLSLSLSPRLAATRSFLVTPAPASERKHFLIPVRVTRVASEVHGARSGIESLDDNLSNSMILINYLRILRSSFFFPGKQLIDRTQTCQSGICKLREYSRKEVDFRTTGANLVDRAGWENKRDHLSS